MQGPHLNATARSVRFQGERGPDPIGNVVEHTTLEPAQPQIWSECGRCCHRHCSTQAYAHTQGEPRHAQLIVMQVYGHRQLSKVGQVADDAIVATCR